MSSKLYDVLIIGGGPAGLSMALTLARQVYSAIILDSGAYRNERATHMHTVPGFDHQDPADFRSKVRAELQDRYASIEYKPATVAQVRRMADNGNGHIGFEAVGDDGTIYKGRKLALATGVRDMVEMEAEGYEECWGRGIFHCLFCHGFEERGIDSVGVLATGLVSNADMISHVAPMAARLAKHVTIYTNGNADLVATLKERFSARHNSSVFSFDDRHIAKYCLVDGGPAVEMTFADGDASTRTEGFLVSHPLVEQRAPFAKQLGLEVGPMGEVKVSPPFNETEVKGCFAAGDASTPMRSVVQAIQTGGMVGVGACTQLQNEV